MANIGRVYKSSYMKGDEKIPLLILDIRTISIKKEFTISVNKHKYADMRVDGAVTQGKEEHPDYHIWCNHAKRGESGRSEIVGSIKNAVSEDGNVKYKRASIFDPFISEKSIYFTLFNVDENKKADANHLYNAVAQPYRNMNTGTETQQHTQASYEPQASYANQNVKDEDGDEIPF